MARNLREGPKWLPGTVIERTGPVSYRVQVRDQVWRRHTDQLLASDISPTENTESQTDQSGVIYRPNTEPEGTLPVTLPVTAPSAADQGSTAESWVTPGTTPPTSNEASIES